MRTKQKIELKDVKIPTPRGRVAFPKPFNTAISIAYDYEAVGLKANDVVKIEQTGNFDFENAYCWRIKGEECCFFDVAYDNFGEIGFVNILKSYPPNQVICCGKVISVCRNYTPEEFQPAAFVVPDESAPQTGGAEITVTCRECEKQITGSRAFLRGMAWKIKKEYAECPACW